MIISELSRTLRIENPCFYVHAIKVSAKFSSKRLLEDLNLLCEDIDSLTKDSPKREQLISRLYLFVEPIRYFPKDKNIIQFADKIKTKYG